MFLLFGPPRSEIEIGENEGILKVREIQKLRRHQNSSPDENCRVGGKESSDQNKEI